MSRRYTIVPLLVALAILASSALCQAWLEPRVIGSLGIANPKHVAVQGAYAYCEADGALMCFDISDPANPALVGTYDTVGPTTEIVVSGDYAYLASDHLRVLDISDPAQPREVAWHTFGGPDRTWSIALSGDYLYGMRGGALSVYDISNLLEPNCVTGLLVPGGHRYMALAGVHAYVTGDDLTVIDISDPSSPTIVATWPSPSGWCEGVAISGSHAYLTRDNKLVVLDISDPTAPTQVGVCDSPGSAVTIAGAYAYLAAVDGGLHVIDISDPTNPTPVAACDFLAWDVAVSGSYAYIAGNGLRVIDITDPTHPTEIGFCDTWGGADAVALSGGYTYVLSPNSLRIIDASNPASPVEVARCDIGGCANDIAISGSHAYVAAAWAGLRIIDIFDPQAPVELGAWTEGCVRSVAVSGSYAYVCVDTGTNLTVLDISDPQAPVETGSCEIVGGSVSDIAISGSHAYVAAADAGMQVIDIGDPANPTPVASVAGWGGGITVSGSYAYFADSDTGLRVIDISNPTAPTVVGTGPSCMLRGWAEIAIAGNRAYVAGGLPYLVVLDISDPTAPMEMGQYHSVGRASAVAVQGSYAYLADGAVGLVILEFVPPQYGPTPVDIEGKMLVGADSGGANIAYWIEGSSDNITPAQVYGRLSPHGDQVIYEDGSLDEDQWSNSRFDIVKANSDGSNPVNLSATAGIAGVNCCADWSPDGSQIAFQHSDPVDGENPCGTGFHVWIMNADGSGAHRLTPEGSLRTWTPSWAPDGSRILCRMGDAWVTIATDGTDFEVIGGAHSEPDWSPDGSKIASCKVDYYLGGGYWDYWHGLQLCDADGRNPQTIFDRFLSTPMMEQHLIDHGEDPADAGDALWGVGPANCQWSPSGDRIAFTGAPDFDPAGPIYREQVEVWVYELATDTLTKITSSPAAMEWGLTWIGPNTSPDDPEVTVGDTTVDFGEVTEGGTTTIVWEDDPPEPPMDYQLVGGAYVASTTAEVSDTISICMGYREEDLPTEPAPAGLATAEYDGQLSASAIEEDVLLLLLKYNEDADYWEDITTFVDTENNLICGETDSLGTFGICLAPRRTWFPDVPAYGYGEGGTDPHWAYDAVRACVAAGIVSGYDDGLYRPELKVTRSAMAVYIARALAGGQENVPAGPEEPTFPDVPSDHWAYSSVEYAAANNVVEGYPGGSYQPAWQVTRAQMAVFIARSIVTPTGEVGLEPYEAPEVPTFNDVLADYWTYKHVEYLAEQAIVEGYPDYFGPDLNAYLPLNVVTRDQMAVYIKRAFELPT